MTGFSGKRTLAGLLGAILVGIVCGAPAARAVPVAIGWFVIEEYLTQYNNPGAMFRGTAAIENPHGCTNQFMAWYEVRAGDGTKGIDATLLAAWVSDREVLIWVDGCTAAGLPRVIQAKSRR